MFFDYVVFGIVDNGVMLISAFFGLGLEKYLPKRFQIGLGAVIGAGLGNAFPRPAPITAPRPIWNRLGKYFSKPRPKKALINITPLSTIPNTT